MAEENSFLLDSFLSLSERVRNLEDKIGEIAWAHDIIAPAYAAPIGSRHWDSAAKELYGNFDGTALGWALVGGDGVLFGSGAVGQVAYFDSPNSVTGDNDFFRDAGNNRVGIGTNTPATTLHVFEDTGALNALYECDGAISQIAIRAYINTAANQSARLDMQRARGSKATPAAVNAGDSVGIVTARGHYGAAFDQDPRGRFEFISEETHTATRQGVYWAIYTTAPGTISTTEKARMTGAGRLGLNVISPQATQHTKSIGSAVRGTIVQGAIGQSVALTEWQDSAASVLAVVTSNGSVGAGTGSPDRQLHSEVVDGVTAAVTEVLRLTHGSTGTPVANFGLGIEFELKSSVQNRLAATQELEWVTATDASRSARMTFDVVSNASTIEFLRLEGSTSQAATIFNEPGLDTDFRVEGTNDEVALFVEASSDFVGMGSAAPTTKLHILESQALVGNLADGYASAITLEPSYSGAWVVTRHNYLDIKNIAGGATVTDAAVMRFNAAIATHKALAAAFTTTDSNSDTTNWALGVIINVNGTLYKLPAVAV